MKDLGGRASATVGAPPEACFELLAAVERYPDWYPELIRRVEVLERDAAGSPSRVRATVHAAIGPLVRDFQLVLEVSLEPGREVRLERRAHSRSDPERFTMVWRIAPAGRKTQVELELAATLEVPRLVPVGGVGERLAQGFVEAATQELEGSGPKAAAGP